MCRITPKSRLEFGFLDTQLFLKFDAPTDGKHTPVMSFRRIAL